MIPRAPARRLLRDILPAHRIAPRPFLRPFASTPSSRLQAQRPPPPPPTAQSPLQTQQQQAAANAALSNLSHLTPAQITALLSTTPPPTLPGGAGGIPGAPIPPPGSPAGAAAAAGPGVGPSRRSVLLRRTLWALFFFALGYKLTDDQIANIRFTAPFLYPPVEADEQQIPLFRAHATFQAIEDYPILQSLVPTMPPGSAPIPGVATPQLPLSDWENWEPYQDFSPERKAHHLCAGPTLNNPNGLGLVNIVFRHKYTGELILAIMFGQGTSGWPSVVHGGMLSTIMDEAMGRLAALNFTANTAVTAKLAMDFKVPVTPGMLYIVRVGKALPEWQKERPDEEDKTDRKLWIIGRMEDPDGATVVEAKGLFVVPKGIEVQPLGGKF
ncbi:HotDog domain-containing protein [Colletotrichum godetiae]|uniref:HotDog domain-containing protein n=1 Tax=Colletotrichum godetiae TaxID=1209918 RepID=A0AAJ0EZJ5_9PEZI|nr:HotDog domain-containing protein [Colletotrichum godetiae]KAK1701339.1 HotDog domain-containing protein [Colletotrichum godetiae]